MRMGIAVIVAGVLAVCTTGVAEAEPNFYGGKQLTVIAPTTAGSGYDAYARTVARALANHIEGNPTILVQNMPGAGGIRAANYLYTIATKDGLTIGELQNGVPFEPFYGDASAKFDPNKFNWLGSPSQEISVFVLWHTAPVNSIADAQRHELVIGAGGASSGGAFYARLASSVFNLKIKLVAGYSGLGTALLAMERGENQGYASAFWSTLKSTHGDWIRDKKIKFLLRYSAIDIPELAGVPVAEDRARTDEDKQVLEVASAPFHLGRPFAAPPGIPSDRLAILAHAFSDTFKDSRFQSDCAKQKLECDNALSGADIAALIKKAYAVPQSVRKRLLAIHAG